MLINHPIYYPLYRDTEKFIILVTGGRGSGKSTAVSAFIERLTFELNKIEEENRIKKLVHNILYTRYTMVSANISVIPEFMEKIELDGTQRYFKTAKNDVTNIKTGGKIMFRGIKTSSGNQTAKLKSIYGITTFVVDEAEEWTSEQEFDTIMMSIRQKGIQNRIVIVMNPTDSSHFIYKKYIKDTHKLVEYDGVPVQISTHPNVLHIHTSYLDNLQFLSDNFLKEAKELKEKDPKKYAHIMMGQWADRAEGVVFEKWGVVKEFPAQCQKVALCNDFGYTTDPTALLKVGIWNNCIYVDELCYKRGMGLAELKKVFGEASKKEDGGKYEIFSESADPRLVDELALAGLRIYPVDKSGNSILAGIEKIKEFDAIYVTERSVNVQDELRNYTYAKDKDGNFTKYPIDEHNHACLIGSTRVMTKSGERQLADLHFGSLVVTPKGLRPVIGKYNRGVKSTYLYTFTNKRGEQLQLTATKDHNVFANNTKIMVCNVSIGDTLLKPNGTMFLVDKVECEYVGENVVYDIEVLGQHCFYANGMLVSNCDALRYYVLCKLLGKILKPKRLTLDMTPF